MSIFIRNRSKRGFIALISILIISVVLLTTVLSLSYKGLTSRFLLLDLERKVESEKYAEGCVAVGIIAVVNDSFYSVTNKYVSVGAGGCELTISSGGGFKTLQVHATSSGATTNLEVVVDPSQSTVARAITSWSELPTLP